jgi:hypothetical protein
MTPEEQLGQLEERIGEIFGCTTRYANDVYEFEQNHGAATTEQKIGLAEKVLAVGPLGIAAHQYECLRRDRLGRPKTAS